MVTSRKWMWISGCGLLVAVWLGLRVGAVADLPLEWIVELRLPRVLVAVSVGAGLAVAGVLVQAIFANPLADPYALGISSAGTLGAVIGFTILEVGWLQMLGSTLGSFVGCFVFGTIMVMWSRRPSSNASSLLLLGISLGLAAASLVSIWIALTDPQGSVQAMRWLLGDLGRSRLREATLTFAAVVWVIARVMRDPSSLDVLHLGEFEAQSLGIDTQRLRSQMLMAVYLLVGLCVSAAGMIGFVGLVVPHLARRWVGVRHSRVLPAAAFLGAIGLVIADAIARTLVSPEELPAGVVTALLGAPIFILIILKSGAREHAH
jgi:ABC-type Fe3+-siderophore transport system permease subunit